MQENINITLETTWDSDGGQEVEQGIVDYNRTFAGDEGVQALNLIVRDETDTIIGGLLGDTYWGWLAINILWLRDDLRGQGIGSRLLRMAEAEAVGRGCKNAHLDTFDFQALDFYRKRGYTVFGQLDGLPPGHICYYLRKTLA